MHAHIMFSPAGASRQEPGRGGACPGEVPKLEKNCVSMSRKNTLHLRKEQIALGVLNRVMASLGRITFEEVHSDFRPAFACLPALHACTHSNYNLSACRIPSSSLIASWGQGPPVSPHCDRDATSSASIRTRLVKYVPYPMHPSVLFFWYVADWCMFECRCLLKNGCRNNRLRRLQTQTLAPTSWRSI